MRQEKVIALLVGGFNVQKAAAAANVPPRSVYRWLADDDTFKAELAKLRGEQFQSTADALSTLQSKAIDKLTELLDSQREGTRLSAVRITLEHAAALRQLTSFEARLAELEGRAGFGDSE